MYTAPGPSSPTPIVPVRKLSFTSDVVVAGRKLDKAAWHESVEVVRADVAGDLTEAFDKLWAKLRKRIKD